MAYMDLQGGYFDFRPTGLRSSRYITTLNLRAFLTMVVISVLPGTASAFTVQALEIGRPELIVPLILLLELPLAVWASGFMGAEDRKTISKTFTSLISTDFATMEPGEIFAKLFWGEGSALYLVFRIWLAVAAAMICSLAVSQLEPILAVRYNVPGVVYLAVSFSVFSYVFIRNLCEECVRSQIGHAVLSSTFIALVCAGVYHFG